MGTDYTNDPRPSPTDEIREYDYDPDATLYDADTNEPIGAATFEQVQASGAAANKDGGSGIIRVDRTTGALSETGRRAYTDGWIEADPAVRAAETLSPEALVDAANETRMLNEPTIEDDEVIVKLADGHTLRSGSPHEDFLSGEYVRFCRPDGTEILYWDHTEWETDPVLVMGAIMNAAAGLRLEGFDYGT